VRFPAEGAWSAGGTEVERELLGFEGAAALDAAGVADLYQAHHFGGLARVAALLGMDVDVVGGEGPWLKLADGSRLLDCHASNGAVPFGHNHPAILRAAARALESGNVGLPGPVPSRLVAAFCHDLVAIAPEGLSRAMLYNSGAEAIEGALVTASLARGRRELFVGFEGGFHGKTAGARSVGGIPNERQGFPEWARTERLPYGDLERANRFLEKKGSKVAAVVVEPLQSNAGVRIPPQGFLSGLQQACRKAGALLIVDEVSTGLGRTGLLFECQREQVVPDLLCLAKALSGGIVPIGAVLVNEGLAKLLGNPRVVSHFATTFSGAAVSMAVALEVVRLIAQERLAERAAERGAQLEEGLRALQARHPVLVQDVRGRGLLWGLELGDPATLPGRVLPKGFGDFLNNKVGGSVAIAMQRYTIRHHRVLLAATAADRRVVRLFPPLTSEPADIEHLLQALERSLTDGLTAWLRTLTDRDHK